MGLTTSLRTPCHACFGRGEDSQAEQFLKIAAEQGVHADQKEEVHPLYTESFCKRACRKLVTSFLWTYSGPSLANVQNIKKGK